MALTGVLAHGVDTDNGVVSLLNITGEKGIIKDWMLKVTTNTAVDLIVTIDGGTPVSMDMGGFIEAASGEVAPFYGEVVQVSVFDTVNPKNYALQWKMNIPFQSSIDISIDLGAGGDYYSTITGAIEA